MSCDQERQLQRLLLVEPGIAVCGIVQAKILVIQPLTSTSALCDRITGKFEVHTTQKRAVLLVDLQRRGQLREDVVERASLDAGRRATCVSA